MKRYLNFFIALIAIHGDLYAAEAGMPQLDPKYWASQAFWLILIFTLLYLSISKFFVPKIRNSIDERNSKIKDDLDEAKNLKDMSEKKLKEYESLIVNAKREVHKIYTDSKKKLNNDENGKIASQGKIELTLINNILDHEYYNSIKKHSFDKKDFDINFVKGLSFEDALANLNYFTAKIISENINPKKRINIPMGSLGLKILRSILECREIIIN